MQNHHQATQIFANGILLHQNANMKLEDLEEVNREVNAFPYKSDPELYKREEFWTEINAAGGDCEDFAIAKLRRLLERGWPIERLRLACCYTEKVGARPGDINNQSGTRGFHAVLIVSADEEDWMLDNRFEKPIPVSDLKGIDYIPTLIQKEGGSNKWAGWIREDRQ
jgi:predicted transglutaminase-like cysteine proteinase